MMNVPFDKAFISEPVGQFKIKTSEYHLIGSIAVVDQGQKLIAGYTDRTELVRDNLPYIIFGDHTRVVKFVDFPFVVGADGVRLYRAADGYDSEFLYFFLKSIALPNDGYGRHSKYLKKIQIPKLNITKQRRIAAQLKARLAEVDKARQAAEVQLREAKILSVALLREIFSTTYLSQYPVIPLGDVGEVVSGVTLGRKISQKHKNKTLRKVPYLRVANVKDGFLDLADVKAIDVTETEIAKWSLQKGDILLTEGGDPDKLGRGTFWSEELPECIHQNHIFRVRFPHKNYLPEFIAAQIGSPYGKDYFFTHAKKTTGIATINQKVLKAFPLQSPELDIQKKIMASLAPRLRDAQTACEAIKQQLQEINLLPQKILAQAFER